MSRNQRDENAIRKGMKSKCRQGDGTAKLPLKLSLMDALGPQKIAIVVDAGDPSAFLRLIRKQARAL